MVLVRSHFEHAIDVLSASKLTQEELVDAELSIGAGERRLRRLRKLSASSFELRELDALDRRAKELFEQRGLE
jgi:hypothetical protein